MITFQSAVYVLCVLTSLACTILLLRGYARSAARLLLWSSMCFVGLTINNILLVLDLLVIPDVDLRIWRLGASLVAVLILLYAFIWEAE